ncbi:MAG: DUF2061 domain-containing protein [Minisyncoccia bacterium]
MATVTTGIIGYYVTGSFELATAIMSIDFFVKLVLYYLHERVCAKFGNKIN